MKRKITFLIAVLMLLTLITQPMRVVGQSTSVTNFVKNGTSSTVSANSVLTYNTETGQTGIDWTTSVATTNWDDSRGHAYLRTSTDITATITGATISEITVVASTNGYANANTISVSVGGESVGSSNMPKENNKEYTFSNVNKSGEIKVSFTKGSSTSGTYDCKTMYIKSISVTYTTGPSVIMTDQTVTGNTKNDGTFTVSYSSGFTPTAGTITLYDNAAGTTPFSEDWLYDVEFGTCSKTTDFTKINYKTSENTTGDTRDVYMKVSVNDGSKGSAEKIVKVTQKRCYTVTFNGHGGETTTSATSYIQYISNGDATNLTANQFEKENSIFTKWTTNENGTGTEYEDEDEVTITADLTLYAQWETKHTITYYANNGWGSEMVSEYAEGTDVTIEENPFIAPSDTKVFKEWNTKTDGDGTPYNPGDVIEDIDDDYELYAIWADKCTVTLISNGMTTTVDVPQGVSYTFPTPINVPLGYVLRGWSIKESDIAAGDVEKSFTPDGSIARFYAVFSEGEFAKITSEPSGTNPWAGDYLIVYEGENKAFDGSRTTLDAANNTISVTINTGSPNTIAYNATTEAAMFTIAFVSGTDYSIKSASGYYIGRTTNSNGIDSNTETAYTNTFSISSGDVTITASGSKLLLYNTENNQKRFRYMSTGNNYKKVQLYKLNLSNSYTTTVASPTIPGDVEITTPTTISSSQTFSGDLEITAPLTISGTAVVTVEGDITNSSASNLIIEDGGQLICSNSVAATFKKTMTAPAAKDDDVYGWELISSPVHDGESSTIAVGNVNNLVTNTTNGVEYDMFAYDEASHTWLNQKHSEVTGHESDGFNNLKNGQGYMYRNNAKELSFVGNTNVADVEVPLTYTDGAGDLKGFHLVGNPYTENITLLNTTLYKGDAVFGLQLSAFYLLNDESNDWSAELGTSDAIANKQGFLIQISEDNDNVPNKIKFSRTARSASKSHGDNIKFTVANSQFEDVTYALFENALPLNKIDHRNPDVPMIYINQNNQDYAVATMSDDTKVFNLGFKASTMGKYTLSNKADGNFDYIHVIDRMTGEDIDMLLEGEYSFIGTPNDNVNRFIVKLGYNAGNEISENEIFAYQSGNDIVVSGEGELQVFDVMGRMVMTQRINGVETINIPTNGMYIFRLNEKVQKIVVE